MRSAIAGAAGGQAVGDGVEVEAFEHLEYLRSAALAHAHPLGGARANPRLLFSLISDCFMVELGAYALRLSPDLIRHAEQRPPDVDRRHLEIFSRLAWIRYVRTIGSASAPAALCASATSKLRTLATAPGLPAVSSVAGTNADARMGRRAEGAVARQPRREC